MIEIPGILSEIGKRKSVGGVRRWATHGEQDVWVIPVTANRRVACHTYLKVKRDFTVATQSIGTRTGLEIVQRDADIAAETPRQVRDGH